jgi:predicted nucleotidyltransferase
VAIRPRRRLLHRPRIGSLPLIDPAVDVPAALQKHPAVRGTRLAGSRAAGRAHELSDWDFLVLTGDFPAVAGDLHELVSPLGPLSELWDPYSDRACYMLMLRGPTKIDLIFPREKREWSPAWEPRADTLVAIDVHFWDWILWLEQKRRGGRTTQLEKSLGDMFELLLHPLGVPEKPSSVAEAVAAYLQAREGLESRYGVRVARRLEREVRPVLASAAPERP